MRGSANHTFEAMEWYKRQSVDRRIAFKELMPQIGGVSWETLSLLGCGYRKKVELLYWKLSQSFDLSDS